MHSIVNDYGQAITVRAVTLPTLIEEQNLEAVDFCKIDIEGSELVALTPQAIQACKGVVRSYFIDTHQAGPYSLHAITQHIGQILANAGYAVELIKHDTLYASV